MHEVKYRCELKHIVTKAHAAIIKSRLTGFLPQDQNAGPDGKYLIRSLYFDNPENKVLHEKMEGLPFKEKYRIRLYNYDHSFIQLEKKVKNYGGGVKFKVRVTIEDVQRILNGDIAFLKESEQPLLREFFLKLSTERFMPRVVVDYKREAYLCPAGNVRITIDSDIKASVDSTDIFNINLPTAPIMNMATSIIEVKYDGFLPEYIQDIIQLNACTSVTVSKYAASRAYM
jgi:SPX domain protein involved in polyphosphate accumulation